MARLPHSTRYVLHRLSRFHRLCSRVLQFGRRVGPMKKKKPPNPHRRSKNGFLAPSSKWMVAAPSNGRTMLSSRVQGGGYKGADVHLINKGKYIVLDNGILQLTLSNPGGHITSVSYSGLSNLLESVNPENNRGYWDLNWSFPGDRDNFDVHVGTFFRVISNDGDKVEVSFVRPYASDRSPPMVPLNIDKRFVLLRGNTGFYTYGIFERPEGWPDFSLNQCRVTFKLRQDRFHHMAVSDDVITLMPSAKDRTPERCEPLAFPEAVLLTDPENPQLKGQVDDKYQYSSDNKDNRVHGWVSTSPLVGLWIITPSDEFRNGGPLKQNLRSHTGPTSLAMFHSAHYAGETLCASFRDGESWQKVFGPVFIYLNSAQANLEPSYLWEDAKQQMLVEVQAWPYSWAASPDYCKQAERGSVYGSLSVEEKFASETQVPASFSYVGLAKPGAPGSWQTESKGYQFWTQADANGNFRIQNIRPGNYNLYGFVPGVIGDYKLDGEVAVHEGSSLELADLVYQPPRHGPTVWEIGVPDRTASHFYVPEPDPRYVNRALVNSTSEKYRQYGLWERYSDLYPEEELVYDVDTSDWRRDWFFLHGYWKDKDGNLKPSTWRIKFKLDNVAESGTYKLQMAVAASSTAAIQVRVNDPSTYVPVFDTLQFGKDNAIARHGIHGLHTLWSVDLKPELFRSGENVIYLTQRKVGLLNGVMYDYLRLEKPQDTVY